MVKIHLGKDEVNDTWLHKKSTKKSARTIEKVWTDEARAKALEARRAKMSPKDIEEVKDFREKMKGAFADVAEKGAKDAIEESSFVKESVSGWYEGDDLSSLESAATQAFGMSKDNARNFEPVDSGSMKSVMKVHAATRAWLDKMYYKKDTVTVYRGVNGNTWEKFKGNELDSEVDITSHNLTSWSTKEEQAKSFAAAKGKGVILKMEIPKEQILMSWATGGSKHPYEAELTVMGKHFKPTLHDIHDEGSKYSRKDTERFG